jgi:hypothetical protein
MGSASSRWSGHWIGHQPRRVAETPDDFLTGGEANHEFSRSMFRRTFDLDTVPAEAPARITADSPPSSGFCAGSQFTTQYNLLFATILLVTIPPLIMFIFFNRKIVGGMAAGSVKG